MFLLSPITRIERDILTNPHALAGTTKVEVCHILACAVMPTTRVVLGYKTGEQRSSQFDSESVFMHSWGSYVVHVPCFAPYDARVAEMGLGRFSLCYLYD